MSPYLRYNLVERLMYSHFLACFVKCSCKLPKSQVLNLSVAKKLLKFYKIITVYMQLCGKLKIPFLQYDHWQNFVNAKLNSEAKNELIYYISSKNSWSKLRENDTEYVKSSKILRIFQISENFHLKLEFWKSEPKSSSGNKTELKR